MSKTPNGNKRHIKPKKLKMAEAPDANTTLDKRTAICFVDQIFQLIETSSLEDIKEVFETLPPDQCTMISNSTIHGCTPLFFAVKLGRVDISRYLLELSLLQGCREMCQSWKKCRHPLSAAMLVDSMELIELISRSMYDINDYFLGPYTPLMLAVFSGEQRYVKLIVELGADINLVCFSGGSPLMASTFNSEVCRFLVNTDVVLNHQDEEGYTALHVAVAGIHRESLKILVDAGADVRIRSNEGMTPLMLSAVNVNVQAVMFLSELPTYNEVEKIEALEALSACFVCAEEPVISYWIKALEMRKVRLPKKRPALAQDILDSAQEFTTESELLRMQDNPLHLAFQGILVIERIFGRNSSIYVRALLQTALIAKHRNNLDKLRELIDYIQSSCQPNSATIVAVCSPSFKNLFTEIAAEGDYENFFKNGAFALFQIIARSTGEMWLLVKDQYSITPYVDDCQYSEIADTFLYMAHTITNMHLSAQYLARFYDVVVKLVKDDPRVVALQSLLHRTIKASKRLQWGSVALIRVLVEAGADVDSKDYFRRTPLMYALKHAPDNILRGIVALLMEYGSHLDCQNSEGFSAMDFRRWKTLSIIPRTPLNLKCQAAHVILNNQIAYGGIVPKILNNFISLHK